MTSKGLKYLKDNFNYNRWVDMVTISITTKLMSLSLKHIRQSNYEILKIIFPYSLSNSCGCYMPPDCDVQP